MNPQTAQDQGMGSLQPQPVQPQMPVNATMPLPTNAAVFGPPPGMPPQPFAAQPLQAPQQGPAPMGPMAPAMGPMPAQTPAMPSQAPPMAAPDPVLRPTVPVHQLTQQTPASGQLAPHHMATPEEAADNDVIEKEWVIKAKQVVAETRHDPFKQVRELNKLKADYMKKRYDKELKLPDA
jgi:hypothetical protein